jgi:DNA-binding transcriptional LysR family regulator
MIDAGRLPALLSLLTVARTGSVGAAARLHHRTSSAISQQVRKLERHLGVRLLERAGRGVRLTAAGEAALPAILQLSTETEALFAQLADLSGRPPATLRVAVSDYLGRVLLVPVLRELIEQQPRLRFEIATTHSREGARLVGLGEVDCAVVTGLEAPRGVEGERLFEQAFVWIGPRRGGAQPPLPDRLAREPLLRLGAGSQGRRLLEDYLARERIQPALLYRPGFRRGAAGDRFATRLVAEGRRVGERLARAVPAMGGRAATRARRGTRRTST